MKAKSKQSGLTLTEMTVVIASMVLLAFIGLPAVRAFIRSFENEGSTKSMISSALASARAMAAKNQKYAGIRFQQAYRPEGSLTADQYMIFIIHDPAATRLANGFRAVEGTKPIKLPDNIGIRKGTEGPTTLSIVFSPSGKLVIHEVRVMNKDSEDDIFNTLAKITHPTNPRGMFVQDDGDRPSQNSFTIYNKTQSEQSQTIYINSYTGTIISE